MSHGQQAWSCFVMACGVGMLLLAGAQSSEAGLVPQDGWGLATSVQAGAYSNVDPLSRFVHRLSKHAEHATLRVKYLLSSAGVVWMSIFASALMFMLVAAVSSAMDFRMLALRRRGLRAVSRYLVHGALTFIRILFDRRTPAIARLILLGALVYWLFPIDLIPDSSGVPGFADDLLIAVVAAKGFVYLCPDALVARHAAIVEAHA